MVTAKAAQKWQGHFNEEVDELMILVNKIDTDKQVMGAGELLDVYHRRKQKPARLRKKKLTDSAEKPFEFLVFCN